MKTQIPYWRLPIFISFNISDTASNRHVDFHRSADNIKVPCNAATKPENITVDGSINNPDVSTSTLSTQNTREYGNTMDSIEFPNQKTIPAINILKNHTTAKNVLIQAMYI